MSVRACAAAKRRCRRRGAVETGGRNAILTHVDHLQIEQCCALVALSARLFDLFDRHFRAVFVVPAQHVFAFEVVVGHRCGAAVGVGRNGADVKQRERVLIALELAKVMLVRARHRVYEALVREHNTARKCRSKRSKSRVASCRISGSVGGAIAPSRRADCGDDRTDLRESNEC